MFMYFNVKLFDLIEIYFLVCMYLTGSVLHCVGDYCVIGALCCGVEMCR